VIFIGKKVCAIAILVLLFLSCFCAFSTGKIQEQLMFFNEGLTIVQGKVTNSETGKNISNAFVQFFAHDTITYMSFNATTDENGYFEIDATPPMDVNALHYVFFRIRCDAYHMLQTSEFEFEEETTNYIDFSLKPVKSDLTCKGELSVSDVGFSHFVPVGEITISNTGAPATKLNYYWDTPDWAFWKVSPSHFDLKPEDGEKTIYIEVFFNNERRNYSQEFSGDIKLRNSKNSSDYELIPIRVTTSRNRIYSIQNFLESLFESYQIMFQRLVKLLL
jgi:hypothetical protein